jgi:galactokinase
MYTLVLGRAKETGDIIISSANSPKEQLRQIVIERGKTGKTNNNNEKWSNYIRGVIDLFPSKIKPFNAVILTSVPLGGGLSSSAALEIAMATFLEVLSEHNLE